MSTPRPGDPGSEPDLRVVGRVVRAHGLRGELVVESRTDNVAERFAPGAVLRTGGGRPAPAGAPARPATLTVTGARHHGERLLVTVAEVADRDTAEALRTVVLSAPPLDTAPEDPDEFHDHQLEGLAVVLADGTAVGTVSEVLHGAGPDVLAVARTGGGEVLVPFVAALVPEVDVAAGRLVLDPPEGLLDP